MSGTDWIEALGCNHYTDLAHAVESGAVTLNGNEITLCRDTYLGSHLPADSVVIPNGFTLCVRGNW